MPDRRKEPLHTPDGRYLVVRGRLWRLSNPKLQQARRAELVSELMAARAALRRAADADLRGQVRARIDAAKKALGERGAVWWTDGAPDYNRHLVKNTPYAAWYASVSSGG
jgi:alkylation response protein AidB-like acyl-CoA dehydrogenase